MKIKKLRKINKNKINKNRMKIKINIKIIK